MQNIRAKYGPILTADCRFYCGHGWEGIIDRLLGAIAPLLAGEGATIHTFDQRHGSFLFETDYSEPFTPSFLFPRFLAECRSRQTCEKCGRAGRMRKGNFGLGVRCDECADGAPFARPEPPPAWIVGRMTSHGYLWYDPEGDDVRIVADPATIGMPQYYIDLLERGSTEGLPDHRTAD